MLISIIIPTLNEEEHIEQLITYLRMDPSYPLVAEIIIVDGHSDDRTASLADQVGAVVVNCLHRNRAIQMNQGAAQATGEVLYFLHADTFPPLGYAQKIRQAVKDDFSSGCFRLKFDWAHWFLQASSWFTRFSSQRFRFGDQSLFIKREAYLKVDGFNQKMKIFEDQEIVKRLSKYGPFIVHSEAVTTSARKYRENGPFRLQLVYFWIYLMYSLGFSQQAMLKTYKNLIPHPRI